MERARPQPGGLRLRRDERVQRDQRNQRDRQEQAFEELEESQVRLYRLLIEPAKMVARRAFPGAW